MLIPLLLLWPISLALMWLVAVGVANKPYDRGLEYQIHAIESLIEDQKKSVDQRLRAVAQMLNKSDDTARLFYQLRSYSGALIAGDVDLPTPQDDDAFLKSEIRFRDEQYKGQKVRVAHLWFKANLEKPLKSEVDSPINATYLLQVTSLMRKEVSSLKKSLKG